MLEQSRVDNEIEKVHILLQFTLAGLEEFVVLSEIHKDDDAVRVLEMAYPFLSDGALRTSIDDMIAETFYLEFVYFYSVFG